MTTSSALQVNSTRTEASAKRAAKLATITRSEGPNSGPLRGLDGQRRRVSSSIA